MDIDMESIRKVDHKGTIRYYNEEEQFHRDDGPTIENVDGFKFWSIDGYLHRTDGPAVESHNGDKYWYFNGIKADRKDIHLFTGKSEDLLILKLKYGY